MTSERRQLRQQRYNSRATLSRGRPSPKSVVFADFPDFSQSLSSGSGNGSSSSSESGGGGGNEKHQKQSGFFSPSTWLSTRNRALLVLAATVAVTVGVYRKYSVPPTTDDDTAENENARKYAIAAGGGVFGTLSYILFFY